MSSERWLPVVGYEGYYEVSDWGRVRSLDRIVVRNNGRPCTVTGRMLKLAPTMTGYLQVCLHGFGIQEVRLVHHLVLEAFIGPCPEGMECRHFPDSDRTYNCLWNIGWGTPQENANDKAFHGTVLRGGENPVSILTESDVRRIRHLCGSREMTQHQAAVEFNVFVGTISVIMRRISWKHVA